MTSRISESLSWAALKEEYFIGEVALNGKTVKVNKLQEAFEDGSFWDRIESCADAMYGGNTYAVLLSISKNLSSSLVNITKRPGSPSKTRDKERCLQLRDYVSSKMAEGKQSRVTSDKAYWQYTHEEIDAIPMDDIKTLKSVYDAMASRKAKYPDAIPDMADFMSRYKAVSLKKSAAKKLLCSEPVISDATAAHVLAALKGEGGKKLSKADKEALVKVLESIK